MNTKKKMPFSEDILYYLTCFATLGWAWVIKVIIKKAVMEALNDAN